MTTLKFLLGGLVVAVHLDRVRLHSWPQAYYMPFRTQRPADLSIVAAFAPTPPTPSADAVEVAAEAAPWSGGEGRWRLYREPDHYLLTVLDPRGRRHHASATIASDFGQARLHLAERIWYINQLTRPLAEMMVVQALAARGGLLVHGAALRDHRRGYLFVGRPGAGKSTLAALWGEVEGDVSILGDERIVVRREDGRWFVYGTPWVGSALVVANERVAFDRLFLIERGQRDRVQDGDAAWRHAALRAEIFTHPWHAAAHAAIEQQTRLLLDEVPALAVAYRPEPAAVAFIRALADAPPEP